MHEISLTRSIFRSLEAELTQEELSKLVEIRMKIGELSGTEPILLQNAFEIVRQETPYKEVSLKITQVRTSVFCPNCHITFYPKMRRFICPSCSTPSNHIQTGEEMLIEQVVFSDD